MLIIWLYFSFADKIENDLAFNEMLKALTSLREVWVMENPRRIDTDTQNWIPSISSCQLIDEWTSNEKCVCRIKMSTEILLSLPLTSRRLLFDACNELRSEAPADANSLTYTEHSRRQSSYQHCHYAKYMWKLLSRSFSHYAWIWISHQQLMMTNESTWSAIRHVFEAE